MLRRAVRSQSAMQIQKTATKPPSEADSIWAMMREKLFWGSRTALGGNWRAFAYLCSGEASLG